MMPAPTLFQQMQNNQQNNGQQNGATINNLPTTQIQRQGSNDSNHSGAASPNSNHSGGSNDNKQPTTWSKKQQVKYLYYISIYALICNVNNAKSHKYNLYSNWEINYIKKYLLKQDKIMHQR